MKTESLIIIAYSIIINLNKKIHNAKMTLMFSTPKIIFA